MTSPGRSEPRAPRSIRARGQSLSHAERAGYLRAIAAGLRERAADLSQVWPRESGVLYAISSTVASEAAAAFEYYAGLADAGSRSRSGPPLPIRRIRPDRPRAGRRGGRHHPVERPAAADQLQDRACAAGRAALAGAEVLAGGSGRGVRHLRDRGIGSGLPPGALNVVTADREVSELLVGCATRRCLFRMEVEDLCLLAVAAVG